VTGRRPLSLVTPEGVPLELELATLSERFMAFFLDLALLTFGLVVLGVVAVLLGLALPDLWAVSLLGLFAIRHGYFLFFELRWRGTTPGKRALRLHVLSRDGGGLGVDAVFARNLLRDVELFLPLAALALPERLVGPSPAWLWLPAVGWVAVVSLLPVVSRERTRAGDLVAGTVVVRVPRAALLADEAARTAPAPLEFTPAQLSVYGERELEALAGVLRRADEGQATVQDLHVIAATIARKVGFEGEEPNLDPASFLRTFYRAQRARLEERLLFGKRKASKLDEG